VTPLNSGTSHTVTLIAGPRSEEAQATIWRPISWKWPVAACPPSLEIVDWRQVAHEGATVSGQVALVVPPDDGDAPDIFYLLDRLAEQGIPVVALGLDPGWHALRSGPDSPIVLAADTEPQVVAATLHALAHRQDHVELLRAEVSVARRFQGGLRGEIEKIHDELQLAASVQREFLPRSLPPVSDVDIQVLFRPCGYVSGDIYDVQQVGEHQIGFFLADAVGHGVPAALMTMVLCRCLTTTACEDGCQRALPPGEVMRLLNQDLIKRHGDSARFATAVYGVIDTRTRRVSVAGAGHPYPLVLRAGGEVERLETTGGMLGLFPDDAFTEASADLGENDMLVLYSDGFETAFPAAEADQFGRKRPNTNYIERFAQMAQAWRDQGLSQSIRLLCEQIDGQSGSLHQRDDLTAMMIVPSRENDLDRLFRGEKPHERAPEREPGPAAPLG
jgi:phosphoserine phosphatase RsbU/P